jgi:hypothetical protein
LDGALNDKVSLYHLTVSLFDSTVIIDNSRVSLSYSSMRFYDFKLSPYDSRATSDEFPLLLEKPS